MFYQRYCVILLIICSIYYLVECFCPFLWLPHLRCHLQRKVVVSRSLEVEVAVLCQTPEVDVQLVQKSTEQNRNCLAHFRNKKFWKENSHRFPFLSIVSRDSLAVPASSGWIERAYSTGADILTAKGNWTKPDLFSNLMLIKCNAKVNAATIKL